MHGVASPNVRSDRPPTVRPRGRGSLPRLPAERLAVGLLVYVMRPVALEITAGDLALAAWSFSCFPSYPRRVANPSEWTGNCFGQPMFVSH
jgi:hypothetical protein